MPKSGTIFNRIFRKGRNPVNVQRVVISDAQKHGGDESRLEKKTSFEPLDFDNLYEENLEDTPSSVVHYEKPAKQQGKHAKKKQKGIAVSDKLPAGIANDAQRRYKDNIKFSDKVSSLFGRKSKTSNSAALEFAESKRRVGRKGRRNRKIAIYAGTGVIVVVLMLVVVLVPGGAAAPAGAARTSATAEVSDAPDYVASATDGTSPDITEPSDVSLSPEITDAEGSATADLSASPAVSEEPSPTAIETTPPDKTAPSFNVDNEVEKTFKVDADLYYNDVGYSSNYYKYTDEELYMLAQVIHAEARGESPKGKIAVGNVVMNRVLSRGFPGNNIKDVVSKPGQFAYNPNTKPGYASKLAARQVLDFQVWVIPQNVYFFKVASNKANWGSHAYVFNIGAHAFYTASYGGRYKGDNIPPALYQRTYKWPTMGCKPEERVYRLQYMLNKLGYDVKADKYFGEDTKEAVMDFQKKKGLEDDGVAGPATLKALIYEFGIQNYYQKFLA
jgi:spore germination cell wall hydrolase CwlJ-like protein